MTQSIDNYRSKDKEENTKILREEANAEWQQR